MDNDIKQLGETTGDGGAAKVTESEMSMLRHELKQITSEAVSGIAKRADLYRKVRYCQWPGQSTDGRKHQDDKGEPVFPFEGASDTRVRLADAIIRENVLVCVAAATRATVRVKGQETTDSGDARKKENLIKWQIKNNIGWGNFLREVTLMANYMQADSPAAALWGVYWEREDAMVLEKLTTEEFAMNLAQSLPMDMGDMAQELMAMVNDPQRSQEAAVAIQAYLPEIKPARAAKMVKQLRTTGECEYPRKYRRLNRPVLKAERLFETIYMPINTTDVQRARIYFMPEWLTRAEAKAMSVRDNWDPEFTRQLLGDGEGDEGMKGKSAFVGFDGQVIDSTDASTMMNQHQHEYEVITALYREATEDGVLGIYMTRFHGDIDVPAGEKKLVDYKHGKYPFVWLSRETLSERLLDSRSVAEVSQSEQETMKLLGDSFNDHVQLSTVPPIFTPMGMGDVELSIKPLAKIPRRKPTDYEWMQPPQYPQSNDTARKDIKRQVDEYHGRYGSDTPKELWALHKQGMVDRFLASLQDAYMMLIQNCQEYMTDEEVQRVTGGKGMQMLRSVEEIQGQFDIELNFDVRDLDQEYLAKLAQVMGQWVVPLDTNGTIMRDRLVNRIFSGIDPVLAEDSLRPLEDANQAEIKDEQDNFAKISAGVEPPMQPQGQNYALRLQTLMGVGEQNPEAFQKLSPTSRQILEGRLKHLEFQVAQEKNKVIGQVGTMPVLTNNQ